MIQPTKSINKGRTAGLAAIGIALGAVGLAVPAQAQDKKPNVTLIVTDDMGWGDPGSYGVDRGIKTPALDQMAAEGVRFTSWYAEASCTPGRAAIQTGRLPIRSALTVALGPGSQNKLLKENRTIAEFYRDNGYQTYFSGKWHLGDTEDTFPINHGYDEMKHFVAYYAGIYAYTDADLYPSFPRDNEKFMTAYNKMVNDGERAVGDGQVRSIHSCILLEHIRNIKHGGFDWTCRRDRA